jgi:hypothetical protein
MAELLKKCRAAAGRPTRVLITPRVKADGFEAVVWCDDGQTYQVSYLWSESYAVNGQTCP